MKTNRHNIYFLFLLLGLVLCFNSCEDENFNGEITGFVKLYNKDGYLVDDKSGVKVTIGEHSTYTNSAGKYLLSGIHMGTYLVKYSYEDYSNDSNLVAITPGEIPILNVKPGTLCEYPDVEITSLEFKVDSNRIELQGTLSKSFSVFNLYLFIGDSPNVSYYNYDSEIHRSLFWIATHNLDLSMPSYNEELNLVFGGLYMDRVFPNDSAYIAVYISNPFCKYKKDYIKAWTTTKVIKNIH